jgi:hypothetical protein
MGVLPMGASPRAVAQRPGPPVRRWGESLFAGLKRVVAWTLLRPRGPNGGGRNQAEAAVKLEPMTGIEPAYSAWEADVLPLNYIGLPGLRR